MVLCHIYSCEAWAQLLQTSSQFVSPVKNVHNMVESGHYLYVVPTGKFVNTLVTCTMNKSILDKAKMGRKNEYTPMHYLRKPLT